MKERGGYSKGKCDFSLHLFSDVSSLLPLTYKDLTHYQWISNNGWPFTAITKPMDTFSGKWLSTPISFLLAFFPSHPINTNRCRKQFNLRNISHLLPHTAVRLPLLFFTSNVAPSMKILDHWNFNSHFHARIYVMYYVNAELTNQ